MIDFASILNPEQLEAATSGDGAILVLAAAGTGKTQTLVYRVAYLVERGIAPESILLLTFTNKAAREMLERADTLIGQSSGRVWGGTFHSVCNRMLRRYAALIGYRGSFVIADRDDSRKMLDNCMKELKLGGKEFPKKDVLLGFFSNVANRSLTIEEVLEPHKDLLEVEPEDICRIYHRYTQNKTEQDIMDFDDLLVNGVRLLQENEMVRQRFQRQFRHVLVDEYQDTNFLQAQLVDLLGAGYGNIMAVGDDFQCIYSWRGADFRNIMEFTQRYPNAKVVKLERNYRSTPQILEVANAVIMGNPEQYQKSLSATREDGRKPLSLYLSDGRDQADAVIDLINSARNAGRPLRDIAILYRAHFHSIELQIALAQNRIPYYITSGIGVFEQAHVKDVLALLRVASSPHDRLAFDRLLCLLPGIGPRTAATYWIKLGSEFDSADAMQRLQLLNLMKPAVRPAWETITKLLVKYHSAEGAQAAKQLIYDFNDAYYRAHVNRSYDKPEERIEDVEEVANQIGEYENLRDFLQEVALLTNSDQIERADSRSPADAVRLSTIHQAKGLEWPMVFIIWASEGMFPSSRALGEDSDASEERRLFYVATTRARDVLNICTPEWRKTRDGAVFNCKPSRFVREIPETLLRVRYGHRY